VHKQSHSRDDSYARLANPTWLFSWSNLEEGGSVRLDAQERERDLHGVAVRGNGGGEQYISDGRIVDDDDDDLHRS
jgi:hypothetical protein